MEEEKKLEENNPIIKKINSLAKSYQPNLEITQGKYLIDKERLEKEEDLVNQWLLSCRQESNHDDCSAFDTIIAINYLEKYHIYIACSNKLDDYNGEPSF